MSCYRRYISDFPVAFNLCNVGLRRDVVLLQALPSTIIWKISMALGQSVQRVGYDREDKHGTRSVSSVGWL